MQQRRKMSKKERRNIRRKRIKAVFHVILVLVVVFTAVGAIYSGRGLNVDIDNGDDKHGKSGVSSLSINDESSSRKPNVYNLLVYGRDKVAYNSDTIMVVNFDAANKKVSILHIPRDTVYIDDEGRSHKINYAYSSGQREGLIKEVEQLLGINIDKYVNVSTDGFRKIVDEIGGVEIDVPQDMYYEDPYQDLVIDIKAGPQVLDGAKAEGFVRFRSGYADADLGRIKAQKLFITEFINTLLKPENITRLPELTRTAFEYILTDLTVDELIYLALQASTMGLSDVTFYTVPGENYGANFAMYRNETADLMNNHFNVYTDPILPEDLETMDFEHMAAASITDHEGTTAAEYAGEVVEPEIVDPGAADAQGGENEIQN